MKLSLYNTLTRKTETFRPIDDKLIKMYVCGPTVYDRPHVGNARSVVIYDLLFRLLSNVYGQKNVLYVRNITDVDDKIIKRARERRISIAELTKETSAFFAEDMIYLKCLSPSIEPKATEHINEMISLISKLLDLNIAYKKDGHVFFDVSKANDYTKLSGRSLDEMLEGVRIENSESKVNAADFVLWKPAKSGDQEDANFDSPFGLGRPGWHIECSAMSSKYLGNDFDIHGGGLDLVFPHHTNEIAQSCSAFPGSKYANYWVHNGFLTVDKQKMSKSLGNFYTVEDLRQQGIAGDVLRHFLFSTHYRNPLDYNQNAIENSQKMIAYWQRALEGTISASTELPEDFLSALLDDLNISVAFKLMNDYAKTIFSSNINAEKQIATDNLSSCMKFLNFSLVQEQLISQEEQNKIEQLIETRSKAKQNRDWALADKCREELSVMKIEIQDLPNGTSSWRKK